MATNADKLVSEIRSLPNEEKIRVLDALLTDLHQLDPEIDARWAVEARRRWQAYKSGELASISYEELMKQYKSK
ncbi:MAG TPA: addiction module protein [Pyrinomonadaceae bacterium]|jgi:hypothetical protein|nr:addiction module protein [Pyrinomonadaceae bacterium]